MIEVVIDSIRVSLMSQHRLVVLKDINSDRYVPIWISPFEADAITLELQGKVPPRPMTHDLIKSIIEELGGRVVHVLVNDLHKDVYYARIVVEIDGKQIDIDSRSSDAIAVAVRAKVPIFVATSVMEKAAVEPDEDVEHEVLGETEDLIDDAEETSPQVDSQKLSAFADFLNTLDLDLDDDDDKD